MQTKLQGLVTPVDRDGKDDIKESKEEDAVLSVEGSH